MNRLSKGLIAAIILASSGLIFAGAALAVPQPPVPSTVKPNLASRSGTATGSGKLGVDTGKLRACQVREQAMKQRSLQLVKLATNMQTRFETIAARVETFYTATATTSGKTVANYNALVADIAAKKTSVSAALVKTSAEAADFSCTGNDPKGQVVRFQTDMQSVMGALKNYRTSIKNLIVAVRSVVGQEAKK